MTKLYFVFEPVTTGNNCYTAWDLHAIYDKINFEVFCAELQDRAKRNIEQKYEGTALLMKEKIMPRPEYPENLEKTIKQMNKQSNEYRLAGNFDAFIAINHEIRELNHIRKQQIAYERSIQDYERAKKQVDLANSKYKAAVEAEYNKLLTQMLVVSANVELRPDDHVRINIYTGCYAPYEVTHVDFEDSLVIINYPSYISFLKRTERDMERMEDSLRHSRKHYNARKTMLDNCKSPRDSLDFKKTFKLAVDAYYAMERAQTLYDSQSDNIRQEEKRIKEAFKQRCFSVVTPINKSYLVERAIVGRFFKTSEILKFGSRERLPSYNA